MTGNKRESLLVAGAFIVAAIALTLPLALNLKRALPSDHGDTLLITWIIGWDADRLRHGLRGLWDAPIFFPYRGTLAFSETMLGVAVFAAPVYWITADPVLTYNVAFLIAFAIAGAGMYLLARELTGSRAAAVAAGMYYAFGPFRMSQSARADGRDWLDSDRAVRAAPLFLDAAAALARPVRGRLGAPDAVEPYIGYFIAVPIAVVIADGVWRERARAGRGSCCSWEPLASWSLRRSRRWASPTIARASGLSPGTQRRRGGGQQRRPAAYVVGKDSVGVWRWLPTAVGIDPEKELFPGLFARAWPRSGAGAPPPIRGADAGPSSTA